MLVDRAGNHGVPATNAQWRRDRFYSHIKLAEAYLNMPDRKRDVAKANK